MHDTITAPVTSHHEHDFVRKYIFTTDHKIIGLQYIFTGLFMALLGGFLAYVIRHQLAFPGEKMPMHPVVAARQYYTMITMHGTIMIFWVAMPILIGGFGNFLIPLMCGADAMAFPKLNMLSFWIFFLSTVVLISSFFVPGGAAAGGWTSYPPLSVQVNNPNKWGQLVWILAVALEFVSMLMGGVNYLTTPLNMRAPGMKMLQLPVFVWMQMTASLLFMISVGPLIGGAVLMICDILFQTGVYMPERGGDPLLWQHLFWFFGHPEVYVVLLPCLGIIGEIIPTMARKHLFGYKPMIYSAIAAGMLSIVVWAHHQFVSGMDPRMAMPFSIATIIISVPVAIVIFSMIATFWGGSIQFNCAMLWAIGMLVEFLFGGVTGIIIGSAAANIYVRDTYFIVGHFHYTLFPAVFYGMFAGLYFWWPKFFGRYLDEGLGKVHFWGTTVFFNLTFMPMMFLGIMGHQRRVFDPRMFDYLKGSHQLHLLSTYGIYGLWLFQVPFIVAFFKGLMGRKNAVRNPWQGTTLEWLARSPPGHGNFDELPVVYHDPYEFSLPGKDADFLPQWEPSESVHKDELQFRLKQPMPGRYNRTKIDSAVIGMVLVLMAETMLFAGLVGATVMMRSRTMDWPPHDLPRLPHAITVANMAILFASGVVLYIANRKKNTHDANPENSASHPNTDIRDLVLLSAMLGILFFSVQAVECLRLLAWDGATGMFAGIFFGLVGTHAMHVLAGVAALAWASLTMNSGKELRRLKICSMYWYFVVLVWPVIYGLVHH